VGGDDRRAVIGVVGDWSNVPVHAEVLTENGVVRLARFAALREEGQRMQIARKRAK
jgi:DNA-binding transcriptional ArsR family regulator